LCLRVEKEKEKQTSVLGKIGVLSFDREKKKKINDSQRKTRHVEVS